MKKDILDLIDISISKGMKCEQVCLLLQISVRRVLRWHRRADRLQDIAAGPKRAPHALLSQENKAILNLILDQDYVDDSHRVLAAKGADLGLFNASASSVYKIMKHNQLTTDRAGRQRKTGRSTKPDRPELTGPNQRWCWDITYCKTHVRGIFLYLFVLMDEHSRKVIAWRVSWHMTHKEAMELLQDGLEKEKLTDVDVKLPDLINDRGTQMKAKAFMRMCKDLGINQKFARPKTPNDNPFIESLYSIVKGYSRYPEMFLDDVEAILYFTEFFEYYNNCRLHGKIGFVTPVQKHQGLHTIIIEGRKRGLKIARSQRLAKNKDVFVDNGKVLV
jgi:transposase InsO family protein